MKRCLVILLSVIALSAAEASESDTIAAKPKRNTVFRRVGDAFTSVFKGFNEVDTSFIEQQHYNYTAMLQNTNTYEMYMLRSKSGQSLTFAPKTEMKVGPYFGWRWIFLGYTFDINHINNGDNKKEFDLSLYSSLFGIDLYYRKAGGNYLIRDASIGGEALKGVPFSGLDVDIKGFDLYYIFNHRKFSYPAAFSQSTCQRRSCGSPLMGIGYTRHKLTLDHELLQQTIFERTDYEAPLDSGLMFNEVRYASYSISGGYAYNWVFAHNWLFAASLSVALAYKQSEGDLSGNKNSVFRDFDFNNVNIDGIGRFGLVWNNTKYFAGASAILHSYNYHKSQFWVNSVFGSVNVYVGFNFGKK